MAARPLMANKKKDAAIVNAIAAQIKLHVDRLTCRRYSASSSINRLCVERQMPYLSDLEKRSSPGVEV